MSALAMLPLVALLAVALGAQPALTVASIGVGSAAAPVQALELVRWPFAVPELARRYVAADGPDASATRRAIEVTFATLHRLLGVGIGEHLGYLLRTPTTRLTARGLTDRFPSSSSRRASGREGPFGPQRESIGPEERSAWHVARIHLRTDSGCDRTRQ